MKAALLAALLASCAHNYADAYLANVIPEASRHVIDENAVLGRVGLHMFVCISDEKHHTSCYDMIDWTPKPTSKPTPAPAPAPVQPDAGAKGSAGP